MFIMPFAKHLTIIRHSFTNFRPRFNVIRLHLTKFIRITSVNCTRLVFRIRMPRNFLIAVRAMSFHETLKNLNRYYRFDPHQRAEART